VRLSVAEEHKHRFLHGASAGCPSGRSTTRCPRCAKLPRTMDPQPHCPRRHTTSEQQEAIILEWRVLILLVDGFYARILPVPHAADAIGSRIPPWFRGVVLRWGRRRFFCCCRCLYGGSLVLVRCVHAPTAALRVGTVPLDHGPEALDLFRPVLEVHQRRLGVSLGKGRVVVDL